MSGNWTGSLVTKRKADLVDIATALGHDEPEEHNMAELREWIQVKLDANANTLRVDDRFKGLYNVRGRRTAASDEDTPAPDTTQTPARRRRNKVLDSLVDAASIPLPDSPIANKIQEAADNALTLVDDETQGLQHELAKVTEAVTKFAHEKQLAAAIHLRDARDFLSRPVALIAVAILIEELFLFAHVAPIDKHIFTFPPPVYEQGSFASLLRSLFFWMPRISWTWCIPKLETFGMKSPLWPAATWWFVTTVVPPFLLSTVISFVPQKGVNRRGSSTRYQVNHPPIPTFDDLAYSFIRLAILLLPLTNAAPRAFVEAMEKSGNSQARALGAALLAALLIANRFGQAA